jgi:hypothetical protein
MSARMLVHTAPITHAYAPVAHGHGTYHPCIRYLLTMHTQPIAPAHGTGDLCLRARSTVHERPLSRRYGRYYPVAGVRRTTYFLVIAWQNTK